MHPVYTKLTSKPLNAGLLLVPAVQMRLLRANDVRIPVYDGDIEAQVEIMKNKLKKYIELPFG